MNRLIENAESQLAKFGKIRIIIYPDRDHNDPYEVIEHNMKDALFTISDIYNSMNDDIAVHHANYYK